MKKTKATHTVTRSAARFGIPDPAEVCEMLVESIPSAEFMGAEAFLDLGQGCCGISRAIVKRLEREGYDDHFGAIFKVHGVDNDLALVKKAKNLGFINSVCSDLEEFNPDRKFTVIVGNPPYANPDKAKKTGNSRSANGVPLWVKFIKKSAELLSEGGFLVLLVPSAVATPGSRGMSATKGLALRSVTFNMEKYFNVSTDISLVVWEKTTEERELKVNGLDYPRDLPIANVQGEEELDLLKKIWSGSSSWKYMDNRGHSKRENLNSILFIRRMYSGEEFGCQHGLDLSRFDRESVVGMEGVTPPEADEWVRFFSSENGRFLRKVTNYSGNVSAHFLKLVNPSVV
jgi:hypothetical protein